MECLLQEWQRGVLDYSRVCDGGVKDEHLLDYNYMLLKVRSYECNAEVGGGTRQEAHYHVLREFRAEKGDRAVRCSHAYIELRH